DGDNAISKRMIYGGAAFRTEKLLSKTVVVTLGVGVFEALAEDATRNGMVTEITDVPASKIKRVESHEKNEAVVNLATAKRLVDVGRGFAKEEDLELGRKVASLIGADVGCSRPVAEGNGWMPKSSYIGVTGVIIKPELCFMMGISGQVQHLVGINQSKTVVAINKDKNAPIFKHVDFGVVGDMYKILPRLIERLSAI
ncbi:MAG: FAD-binding protein, partial [Eubacteriales bacterium]